MSQTQKVARTRVCVNRDIQGKIVSRLAKYWILYHLVLWSVLFAVECLRYMISGHLVGSELDDRSLAMRFIEDHWIMLMLPVLMFPVILWDMVQLTHKVAGPLVRFQNALKDMAAGKTVEKISLRKGDLLTEFQNAFNESLKSDRVRNSSTTVVSASNSLEIAILDDVARLNAELKTTECEALPTR